MPEEGTTPSGVIGDWTVTATLTINVTQVTKEMAEAFVAGGITLALPVSQRVAGATIVASPGGKVIVIGRPKINLD